jgi:hypothetical protein
MATAVVIYNLRLSKCLQHCNTGVKEQALVSARSTRIHLLREGLITGLGGAVIAFSATYMYRDWMASFIGDGIVVGTPPHYVSSREAILTGVVLIVVGAAVGVIGSVFTITRWHRLDRLGQGLQRTE